MHHCLSIRVAPIAVVESYLINIHGFQIFQPVSIKDDGIQGVLLDASQSLPGVPKWLPLLSRCLFWCLLLLLLLPFSSPRAYLSFTFSHHQTFVLIMLKLLFLVSMFYSQLDPKCSDFYSQWLRVGVKSFQTIGMQNCFGPSLWNTSPTGIQWTFL